MHKQVIIIESSKYDDRKFTGIYENWGKGGIEFLGALYLTTLNPSYNLVK